MILQVDIQNLPVIPGECFEPLKAEPQEMFGGSNTSSNDVCVYRGSDGVGMGEELYLKMGKGSLVI